MVTKIHGTHTAPRFLADKPYRIPTVDGLIWQDAWGRPHEGALTQLWKIAAANCLTPHELCNSLFHKRLLSNDVFGLHGRSLLSTRWMTAPEGNPSQLAKVVSRSGLDAISAKWATVLASDRNIRYCPLCMAEGYQSALCQMDGLIRCPIHDVPILDICAACLAPTPRYALTTLTMSSPFYCPNCGRPYGGCELSLPFLQFSQEESIEIKKYGRLSRWLSKLDASAISWPLLESWQCCAEGEVGNKERRTAVLSLLNRLFPLGLAKKFMAKPPVAVSIFPNYHTLTKSSGSKQGGRDDECDRREKVYSAIRRHIRRALGRNHRNCLKSSLWPLEIEWGNEVLRPVVATCPLAFGYYLWRHHFETNLVTEIQHLSLHEMPKLRKEVLSWPADFEVSTKVWATFALMSFFSYTQVAREWCNREEAPGCAPQDFQSLMENITDFRRALSPQYMAWSPRITYLQIKEQTTDVDTLVIAMASGTTQDLLWQPPCLDEASSAFAKRHQCSRAATRNRQHSTQR